MPNITLSVDEEAIKKVRKIAVGKNTTLTAMVREYLVSIANRDLHQKTEAIQSLERSIRILSRDMGPRQWRRRICMTDREMVSRAIAVNQRYGVTYWDGLIIAAAERSQCAAFLTEDLGDGQRYFGITVSNPFS